MATLSTFMSRDSSKMWNGRRALHAGLILIVLGVLFLSGAAPAQGATIPTFSIVNVVPGVSVTVRTYNFPADQNFTVRMGPYGTLALGGTVITTTNSGAGGSFEETYTIPSGLVAADRIAIRMDSAAGFYAYNWFWNSATAVTPIPGTGVIPTFSIVAVVADQTVTLRTQNFPPNQSFTVRMGAYGTLGIGGTVVSTTNSGAGGSFEETYTIPSGLYGAQRIAIRMDSPQGYFAYNWFWNNTTGAAPTVTPGGPTLTPTPTKAPIYTGIPTFSISGVVRDQTVTILTQNFPPNQNFTVRMGLYGTAGIGGTVVDTTNSGVGGAFSETYAIPDGLKGLDRIAIRLESSLGYYAYNWFWNNTTGAAPTVTVEPSATPGGPTLTPTPTKTPAYSGIPTFSIVAVVRDQTVEIRTNNFPADQNFTVRMGLYGTAGVGGTVVDSTNSGAGGTFVETYAIPDNLKGLDRIAIRLESPQGYYAYNWFWNATAP